MLLTFAVWNSTSRFVTPDMRGTSLRICFSIFTSCEPRDAADSMVVSATAASVVVVVAVVEVGEKKERRGLSSHDWALSVHHLDGLFDSDMLYSMFAFTVVLSLFLFLFCMFVFAILLLSVLLTTVY